VLHRFLPKPVISLLKEKAGSASLQVIDTVCENPEIIWTAEMQSELRDALLKLLGPVEDQTKDITRGFDRIPTINPDYSVYYRQLANEIYLGNVYIRIYLKQPTFRLSNPVLFMEKLTDFWESAFSAQVPVNSNTIQSNIQSSSDSTEIILGKEDFLSLLTSCIVCVIKNESNIVDHLISWNFVARLSEFLQRAIRSGRRGSPLICIVRILHQLISREDVVDNLAQGRVDIIQQLKDALDHDGSIPKDATVMVELLKRIFQCVTCRYLPLFLESAKRYQLTNFVLDRILGVDSSSLVHVLNSAALKIHAVDLIKAIFTADPEYEASLQAVLNIHPAWREYRDQSHDLFLTVSVIKLTGLLKFDDFHFFFLIGSRKNRCLSYSRCSRFEVLEIIIN
jgi:hypothetical protein